MVVFVCEDSFEGILCGVYDAWTSRLGHKNVKLAVDGQYDLEMFADYRDAAVSEEKAQKVALAVLTKISEHAYAWIYRASLSFEPQKADCIYRFLIFGFHIGAEVIRALQIPAVQEVFRLNRSVGNESHLLTEFLRFSELPQKVLLAVIGPKNDVTALLMPHFSDRLRGERFIIFDEKREKAAVHLSGTEWYMMTGAEAARLHELARQTDSSEYAVLWKAFFDSVGIQERTNYVCQRGHLPLRFRPYMTEFQQGGRSRSDAVNDDGVMTG